MFRKVRIPMSYGPKVALAAVLSVAAAGPAAAAGERQAYFLINGPDYRQVSAAQFDHMRGSCLRIERKNYVADRVIEWHCYL
jgi:hypothetical protein